MKTVATGYSLKKSCFYTTDWKIDLSTSHHRFTSKRPKQMKIINSFQQLCIVIILMISILSCKKEYLSTASNAPADNPPPASNKPPIANAGADQTITLPKDSVLLDGTASSDPDGKIISYNWSKISGSSSFVIVQPDSAKTLVRSLVQGIYQFELKVTDDKGATAKSTVIITVLPKPVENINSCAINRTQINTTLIPFGTLSQARTNIAVASAGNKIVFAGGETTSGVSSRVDIYDLSTNTWSTAELSAAKTNIAAAVLGKKIFLAGGRIKLMSSNPWDNSLYSSNIDIYDTEKNSWSTVTVVNDYGTTMSGASAGNKVVFAANEFANIYDASTDKWSVVNFCPGCDLAFGWPISGIAVHAIENNIYLAGGGAEVYHNGILSADCNNLAIRVFDTNTSTWSSSLLQEGKSYAAVIGVGNTSYWAGGYTGCLYTQPSTPVSISSQVEIRDMTSGQTTFTCLFQPNARISAVQKNNNLVFFTGAGAIKNKFDIYDLNSKTWSIGVLPQTMESTAIISVNNSIYVAGGKVNGVLSNQVYKLEF